MKYKKKTGCGCFLLMALIAAILTLRLWGPAPEETYPQADRAIAAFCEDHNLSPAEYPEELRALLERNPETLDFVLHYPLEHDQKADVDLSGYDADAVPLFLQWDRQWGYLPYGGQCAALTGCGPLCLSMAGYYLTGSSEFSPDRILEFAGENGYYSPGNGSSWTLISEGAGKLGLTARELPLVKSRILEHLQKGEPIICAMGPGDFTTSGHFIVLVGVEDGLLQVNDPNSIEKSETLWAFEDIESQFRNLWVISR